MECLMSEVELRSLTSVLLSLVLFPPLLLLFSDFHPNRFLTQNVKLKSVVYENMLFPLGIDIEIISLRHSGES
jgi:hypothetical protein